MPKLAARVLGLLPYCLRAGRSGARPSGPSGPKGRSGQPMARGRHVSDHEHRTETRHRPRTSLQGTGTGAHSTGVWPIRVRRKNITPQNIPKTRLGVRGRLGRFGGDPHLEQESVRSRISAAASPLNQTRRCQCPSVEREAMSRPGSRRRARALGERAKERDAP
jgi:hypothetical protein